MPYSRLRLPAWVWGTLLMAHALAFAYALRTGHYCFPDSGRYVEVAHNLQQHGELYARPWPAAPPSGQAVQEFTIRPPGYPLFILALGGAGGWPVVVLLAQNLLSLLALAVVLLGWARSRSQQPGRWAWASALALTLSFPAQLIYANALMSEVPLQAVLLLGVGVGVRGWQTGRRRYWTGAVGAVAAALLLKPVFFPFALVFLGIGAWQAWQRRRPELLLLGAVPLLVAGLYMGWNGYRTGYVHFSSITDINLLHYNAAGVVRQTAGPAAEEAWVAAVLRRANAQPTFATRQHVIQTEALRVLWQHPLRYAAQHALGMVTLLLDPGRFDLSSFLGQNTAAGLLNHLRSGGLRAVGLALGQQPLGLLLVLTGVAAANLLRLWLALRGLGYGRGVGPTASGWLRLHTAAGRWAVVLLLAYVALLTGPLGAARFLVPVWPLLLGLALRGLPETAALGVHQKNKLFVEAASDTVE